MPTALRARRRRMLVVGLGAALLVPLSVGPAGARTPATPGSTLSAAGGTVVGKVVRAVADPRKADARKGAQPTKPLTWIDPAHGAAVRVPTDQVAHLQLGATVKVTVGSKVTDAGTGRSTLEPARQVLAASVVAPASVPATAAATAPYTDEVTVVKVRPGGNTAADPTALTDLVDTVNVSVADYWETQSQGKVKLHATAGTAAPGATSAPDAADWWSTTADCGNPDALWSEVATDVGFVAGPGQHLLLYLPNDLATGCEYGLGTVGSSLNEGGMAYVSDTLPSVMAHELGHNFGLGHSSEMACDRSVVTGNCGFAQYFDLYDVMGASYEQLGSLSAPQADLIGVLPVEQVTDLVGHAPGTTTVSLKPMGVFSGTRAIKLGASDGLTYWLEYRTNVGQDEWLGDARNSPHLDQGVLLRAEPTGLEDASYGDTSLLLDATPSPESGWDTDEHQALPAGRSVYLSGLDYYVTVQSATSGSGGSAVVRVQVGDAALSRDFDRDKHTDLVVTDSAANLALYKSAPGGGFSGRSVIGGGWQSMDAITMVGDWDGDGSAQDIIARKPSTGELWLYTGNGHGGLASARVIAGGWQAFNVLFSPGDWNGDGTVDLMARRRSDGALLLYPGSGTGGFKKGVVLSAANWNVMTALVSVGDLDGNGTTDFVARGNDGTLYLYNGNGSGGFGPRTVLSHGWQIFTAVIGVGDWDGDSFPDLLARKSDGTLWLYAGMGNGHFRAARQIAGGWNGVRPAG